MPPEPEDLPDSERASMVRTLRGPIAAADPRGDRGKRTWADTEAEPHRVRTELARPLEASASRHSRPVASRPRKPSLRQGFHRARHVACAADGVSYCGGDRPSFGHRFHQQATTGGKTPYRGQAVDGQNGSSLAAGSRCFSLATRRASIWD